MPGVDRTRHKQIRRASGAQPNVRYTSPRYQTGQQTLSAQPLIPLSDRLGYATLTRSSSTEHFVNLSHLDRETLQSQSQKIYPNGDGYVVRAIFSYFFVPSDQTCQ